MRSKEWSVYILRCADGSLYTGISKDVGSRLQAHNTGRGAAYTRARKPVKLAYREDGFTLSAALARETRIKALTRREKLSLIRQNKPVPPTPGEAPVKMRDKPQSSDKPSGGP